MINKDSLYSHIITSRCNLLRTELKKLELSSIEFKERLVQSQVHFLFLRHLDLIDSWISQIEFDVKSTDYGEGKVIFHIEGLISKHQSLESSLHAFEIEAIKPLENEIKILLSNELPSYKNAKLKYVDLLKRWENLFLDAANRKFRLNRSLEQCKKIDELFLQLTEKASSFNSWLKNSEEDLLEPTTCNSSYDIKMLKENHLQFQSSLTIAQNEFKQILSLDQQIKSFTNAKNPYTWHSIDSLHEIWANLQIIIKQRDNDLNIESIKQEKIDKLKRTFATKANTYNCWLVECRKSMIHFQGELQQQLEFIKLKNSEVGKKNHDLKDLECLYTESENVLILDNPYTEHTTVNLAQQWEQLSQLGRRMQQNIQLQIQSRNLTGVSGDDLKEWQSMFNHFDKDGSNKLEESEFKSCLRSLGYSLTVLEDGEKDPQYEVILDQVDPNRLGYILQDQFMSFMISQTTENVQSRQDLEEAFKAITSGKNKLFVTKGELSLVLNPELTEFCTYNMKPYVNFDASTDPNNLDYFDFTRSLFMS